MATRTADFYAWTLESAEHLRHGRLSQVDLERIAEEIEEMGRSERHALSSHLKALVLHLLKWRYQPSFRGVSWQLSVTNARDEIDELLNDSPRLRGQLPALLTRRYPAARQRAALEIGLPESTFPSDCPFNVEQLLDADYWT